VNADYFRTVFGQMYWARNKVLAAAEGLSQEEYEKPNGFTYRSIRGILTHCLSGESNWMARVRGDAPAFVREDDVPTVAALRERWGQEESKARAYLDKLSDADLDGSVTFTGRDGNERTLTVWHILELVHHHTIQHRSEAAEALTMAGRSPGDLDFIVYLNSLRS